MINSLSRNLSRYNISYGEGKSNRFYVITVKNYIEIT